MERERISFDSKEDWLVARLGDVTSTEVSALFGANPFMTRYELWREKKYRQQREIPDNPRMVWGRRLESAVARGVAEDEGWEIRKWNTYERVPSLRVGSSFDYRILNSPKAVLEIKVVDSWIFRKTWVEHPDGTIEPPPYMEFQLQHEMLCSGYEQAYLYALVGGNAPVKVFREADKKFHDAIVEQVGEFWATIDAGIEPEPDYTRDGSAIREKYSWTDPDSTLNAIGDTKFAALCATDAELATILKEKDAYRKAVRAEILDRMRNNEYAIADGFVVSAKPNKAGNRNILIRPERKES